MSSAGSAVTRLAKPKLRGLLTDQIKKNMVVATVLSTITTTAYW